VPGRDVFLVQQVGHVQLQVQAGEAVGRHRVQRRKAWQGNGVAWIGEAVAGVIHARAGAQALAERFGYPQIGAVARRERGALGLDGNAFDDVVAVVECWERSDACVQPRLA